MRALFIVAVSICLSGCARYKAERVVLIPVSVAQAEAQQNPTVDGFGSNFTTYAMLSGLTRETSHELESTLKKQGFPLGLFQRSWHVEMVSSWHDDHVQGLVCRVSLEGRSEEEAVAGIDTMIEFFSRTCDRIYGPRYAPYVRKKEPNQTLQPTPPSRRG